MSVIKEKVVEEVKSILQNSWIWKCWFCDVFKLIDLVHKCSVFDYMAEDEIDFVHCFVIENCKDVNIGEGIDLGIRIEKYVTKPIIEILWTFKKNDKILQITEFRNQNTQVTKFQINYIERNCGKRREDRIIITIYDMDILLKNIDDLRKVLNEYFIKLKI